MWHVTRDTGHVTCDTCMVEGEHSLNISASSLALMVWERQCIEDIWTKGPVSHRMNSQSETEVIVEQPRLRLLKKRCLLGPKSNGPLS